MKLPLTLVVDIIVDYLYKYYNFDEVLYIRMCYDLMSGFSKKHIIGAQHDRISLCGVL